MQAVEAQSFCIFISDCPLRLRLRGGGLQVRSRLHQVHNTEGPGTCSERERLNQSIILAAAQPRFLSAGRCATTFAA